MNEGSSFCIGALDSYFAGHGWPLRGNPVRREIAA